LNWVDNSIEWIDRVNGLRKSTRRSGEKSKEHLGKPPSFRNKPDQIKLKSYSDNFLSIVKASGRRPWQRNGNYRHQQMEKSYSAGIS
jgi:hypothetical protein